MNKFIGYILLAVVVLIFILPLVGSFVKFLLVVAFGGTIAYFVIGKNPKVKVK